MSCLLVERPKENLIEPCAISESMPIALRTWEGSKDPDVQAEPVETAIPSKSNIKRIDSPSISSKEMLTMLLTF